ncbi:hypothetical protein GCM10027416_15130 [Okibacterium endophyticum]
MTPPDEKPLSRRQLREQQQRQATSSASRRVSAPTVAGGEIPDAAPVDESTVHADRAHETHTAQPPHTESPEAQAHEPTPHDERAGGAGPRAPLTRRQARLQRTAAVDVVTPASAPSVPSAPAPEKQATSVPETSVPKETAPASTKAEGEQAGRTREPVTFRAGEQDDHVIALAAQAADEAEAQAATKARSERDAARGDAEAPEAKPKLSTAFGTGVKHEQKSPTDLHEAPFDQIIARGIESAATSSNSLILPTLPSTGPLTGPITSGGDVIITGSVDLPPGLGSTGQHPQHFDKSDIDAMFESDEDQPPSTAGTPVSASKAVSTHTSTRDVINPPAPAKSNRMLMVLAITAGVLAVAVLAVVIIGFAAGAFGAS